MDDHKDEQLKNLNPIKEKNSPSRIWLYLILALLLLFGLTSLFQLMDQDDGNSQTDSWEQLQEQQEMLRQQMDELQSRYESLQERVNELENAE